MLGSLRTKSELRAHQMPVPDDSHTGFHAERASNGCQSHRRTHAERDTSTNRLVPQVVRVVVRLSWLLKSSRLYDVPRSRGGHPSCDGTSGSVGQWDTVTGQWRTDRLVLKSSGKFVQHGWTLKSSGKFSTQEVTSTQCGWFRLLSTLVSLLAFSPVCRARAVSR